MRAESQLWVVVLAGGDGRRLASATTDRAGNHVPKQFCRFGSDGTLLNHALSRAGRIAGPERIVAVVQAAHRRWWESELIGLPRPNVIQQHVNLGTAVALLHALTAIVACNRDAHLLVLPSDQQVEDENAWQATLRRATEAASAAPEHVVLVGVEPQQDPDFGWILPGEPVAAGAQAVLGFSEKPSASEAAALAHRGALVSAFVFAASASALLDLFARHPSGPIAEHARALSGSVTAPRLSTEGAQALPYSDFSHDLLERAPYCARVISGRPCGWTDLGTPARLSRWLDQHCPRLPERAPQPQAPVLRRDAHSTCDTVSAR